MRQSAILLLTILLLPIANAVCIIPNNSIEIKENTFLCNGIYNLENGIRIVNDDLIVDCNNSILTGNGIGYGILLKGRQNVLVKNCNVSNYEAGIYLDNSSNSILRNNYLAKNKFGIALQDSIGSDLDENTFFDNFQDKIIRNINIQQGKSETQVSSKKSITENPSSESYSHYETQTAKYYGNKKLGYYIIYLAVFVAVIVAFYTLYYRFYYERRKLK